MKKTPIKRTVLWTVLFLLIIAYICYSIVSKDEKSEIFKSEMYGTFWSLLPPVFAIIAALITKEVYSSLFLGITVGALFYSNFDFELTVNTIFKGVERDGEIEGGIISKLTDTSNVGIIVFLVVLGILVTLMNMSGGSAAYGRWAKKKIKTRKGAMLSTISLGLLIFIDDYFNCLTVGSVMRPVTDSHGISRAKLAYIIDSIAASVCIIIPVSSWAAAVSGVIENQNGLEIFVHSIPYNIFAFLSISMVVMTSLFGIDIGSMRKHEQNALNGNVHSSLDAPHDLSDRQTADSDGKIIDLFLPVLSLFVFCVIGMLYTGGFFDGNSFFVAIANCDASYGLLLGSAAAMIFTMFLYVPRGVLSFNKFMSAFPEGFKTMAPPIIILTFAWTLGGMTKLLGADSFMAGIMKNAAPGLDNFLPAIVFLAAAVLSFATGTSWGTFAILLPIIVPILTGQENTLTISVAACLAGSICGAQCSPISDITIMSSTGAGCNHINHITTQLPYSLSVACISFAGFIFAGIIRKPWLAVPMALVLQIFILLIMKAVSKRKTVTMNIND
ncbi:MAG: Na+/H+ antiporter NhaC family protein [Firmicutes bacterium]|nr:Na+/H+ antiporter NhaC family protein [Bacillota bacterium]